MIYPKSPFCPLNDEDAKRKNNIPKKTDRLTPFGDNNCPPQESDMDKKELMSIINELEFAVTDLNLFLDTHPNDEEALKTFTTLAAALKSYKHDYAQKFGPLYATDSSDEPTFEWVAPEHKWPWQL